MNIDVKDKELFNFLQPLYYASNSISDLYHPAIFNAAIFAANILFLVFNVKSKVRVKSERIVAELVHN